MALFFKKYFLIFKFENSVSLFFSLINKISCNFLSNDLKIFVKIILFFLHEFSFI